MRLLVQIGLVTVGLLVLTGCSEEEVAKKEEPVRAIKSMVIEQLAKDQLRRISGRIEADTVTDLAFEIGGQLVKLNVEIGDTVSSGTVVALLDAEPYQLQVDKAKGELESARASLNDATEKHKQQKVLLDKGFTTKTSYDSAYATLKTSESQVKIAQSSLSIAERDLLKTKLVAPFNGKVAKRYVDVFSEVASGSAILQLNSDGSLKVEASVPESIIRNLSTGDRVGISFPTIGTLNTEGTISDIGSRAETANAFPVKIELDNEFPELRPGMTAEVTFRFATGATGNAYLIPLTALLPQAKSDPDGVVYAYDPAREVVVPRKVNIVNVRDNELEVTGEIKSGDIIATAGVSFLADGMKVRLMEPRQAKE